jgi:hypothetical protein
MYKLERISRYILNEVEKQYDEYCLSVMQTITYAHDNAFSRHRMDSSL